MWKEAIEKKMFSRSESNHGSVMNAVKWLELKFIYIPHILLWTKPKDVQHIIRIQNLFHVQIYIYLRIFNMSTSCQQSRKIELSGNFFNAGLNILISWFNLLIDTCVVYSFFIFCEVSIWHMKVYHNLQ